MIITGIAVMLLCLLIGIFTVADGVEEHRDLEAAFGVFLLILTGGILMAVLTMAGKFDNFHFNNHKDCVQLVWLDGDWKCVPEEQAG